MSFVLLPGCPYLHPLQAFLLCLSSPRSSFFIHTGLLGIFPGFLLIGFHGSWAWRRQSLISWAPLPSIFPSHSKQLPEGAKVCSPEVQGRRVCECHPHFPRDLELCHPMVTAAQPALELHIPHQPLLAGESKVQHSTSLKTEWRGQPDFFLLC